jgi:hypothetical protein
MMNRSWGTHSQKCFKFFLTANLKEGDQSGDLGDEGRTALK